ncbi:MAG: DUF4411 family protein [Xanthobacteraceae bacterium]
MKKYAFDTSGISNPLETMPEDIHESMWRGFKAKCLESGIIAVTQEIYDEMVHIPGSVGQCIKDQKDNMLMDVGGDWDWGAYITHTNKMEDNHHDYISEYCGGSKKTVGLNDISIIALAKALGLPVVSMEEQVTSGAKKRHIPDVCKLEGVEHLTISQLLRKEGLKF